MWSRRYAATLVKLRELRSIDDLLEIPDPEHEEENTGGEAVAD